MIQGIQFVGAVRSPLFLVHVATTLLCLVLLTYTLRNRRSQPGAHWFGLWLGTTMLWTFTYTLALGVEVRGLRGVLEALAIAFVPVASVGWFCFTLSYSGRAQFGRSRSMLALAASAVAMSAFVATNPLHGLVFTIEPGTISEFHGVYVITERVFLGGYWLFSVYVYALYLVGVAVLVDLLLSTNQLYRDQSLALLVAVCLPLAVATLVAAEALPWSINLAPLSFGVATVPLAYAVFRSDLLELVPASFRLGERRAVETIEQGVLVLDADDSVAFANGRAAELLEVDSRRIVGRDLDAVVAASPLEPAPNWTSDRRSRAESEPVAEDGGRRAAVPRTLQHQDTGRTYEVMPSPIESGTGPALGRTLFVRDVTDERRRKQRLLVLNRVVRHNLRNDMNVLRGHVRLLEEEADDEVVEVIDEIATELIRLGEKAHQMDRIIQEASGADSPVNVAGIVDRVVARYDEGSDVRIDVRGPAQAWTHSHGSLVEAIVENLVENAVEHASGTSADADGAHAEAAGDGADAAGTESTGDADQGAPPGTDDADGSAEAADADAATSGGSGAGGSAGADGSDDSQGGADPGPVPSDRAGRPPRTAPVVVEVDVREDAVTLVVADDGPGIPEQEVATLMHGEVSALQHGSGIGLWMVKWCVDLTNAEWDIDTEDGTRVTVSFPREPESIDDELPER